ncbi:TfoX/Sxy family protein [Fimbriiglobus ruber]|uniref:TfoX N-terminal domain-containing protein n=1 Tax=Fimbriiglobus ruber TaxID=1908690 RepID=A0A225EAD8_9BACT|nr:TfoX/Sxy family protein [Fimbriiglobus ruber]OWK45525.1 hypothetical protein FRUB_01856 [Fimbriiglobus ruber]
MAFDESLAARIREVLERTKGVEEKKMFGGICFLLHGNLLVGVWKDSLIARLGTDKWVAALLGPHVSVFDLTGRPMKNWVMVEPEGVEDDGTRRNVPHEAAVEQPSVPGTANHNYVGSEAMRSGHGAGGSCSGGSIASTRSFEGGEAGVASASCARCVLAISWQRRSSFEL